MSPSWRLRCAALRGGGVQSSGCSVAFVGVRPRVFLWAHVCLPLRIRGVATRTPDPSPTLPNRESVLMCISVELQG